jgi:hypothetical protein
MGRTSWGYNLANAPICAAEISTGVFGVEIVSGIPRQQPRRIDLNSGNFPLIALGGEFDSHPVLHRGCGRMVRHRSRVPALLRDEGSGSFNSTAFRQLFSLFFDLLLDLLGRVPVYLNCVMKRFHLENSMPGSFIAKRGTETVMAQRTVNQDARPGT